MNDGAPWYLQWRLWPQIIAILALLTLAYLIGWRRLRTLSGNRLASPLRLTSFMAGILTLALAMLSPIEVYEEELFTVHMIQHMLIHMIAPPLLLLGEPYPLLAATIPTAGRSLLIALMGRQGIARRILRLFSPWIAWGFYVSILWIWHVPAAYDSAFDSEFLHMTEHTTYFLSALLFWGYVVNAAPRLHGRLGYGFRIAYLLASMAQHEILGIAISFMPYPLYQHYAGIPHPVTFSVMDDQMLGGAVMWVPGGMMYGLSALILLAALGQQEK